MNMLHLLRYGPAIFTSGFLKNPLVKISFLLMVG
jgi:hypothetical protein